MLNGQLDEVNFLLRLSIHDGIESGTEPWTSIIHRPRIKMHGPDNQKTLCCKA